MPPFEVSCDKNRDTVRDRLRQTLSTFFLSFFFFPVIIKFSEPLFRQLLLFEEPVIFYRPGRGGGEGNKCRILGDYEVFRGERRGYQSS